MRHFKLNRADKAKVPGTHGETITTGSTDRLESFNPGWLELCYRHASRGIDRCGRFLGCGGLVSANAELCAIILWHLGAVQGLRPCETEAVHQALAARARALAERPAGRYRLLNDGANRRVDGAEEESQIRAALHLNERHVLMHLLPSVLLLLMIHQVRHDRLIIWDVHAEIDGDGLAAAVMSEGIATTTSATVKGGGRMQGGGDSHHAGQEHTDHRRPQHLWSPHWGRTPTEYSRLVPTEHADLFMLSNHTTARMRMRAAIMGVKVAARVRMTEVDALPE